MKKRLIPTAATVVVFALLCLLGRTWLKNLYLFEWTARHNYLYLWAAVLVLALLGESILAWSITAGNLAGVVLGQCLGDVLVAQKVAKLPPDASDSAVYQAHYHHGVWIWLCVVFAFFVAGVLVSVWQRRKQDKVSSKE